MNPFGYARALATDAATSAVAPDPTARFIAGGTNLLDLMKEGVETPARLIDINALPLSRIEAQPDGGIHIGALARNSAVAYHPLVQQRFPLLSQAILQGASAQLRNMATVGGNVMQRTRCYYFNDVSSPCNKREPGSGCPAIAGYNRIHAILGTSEHCIATHPSDMAVALAALDAVVHLEGGEGVRDVPILDFHLLPGDTPHLETVLRHGELITGVSIPALPWATRSLYLKARDRTSYAFALVSVACALDVQNGTIAGARLALGGVGTKPWRAHEAEQLLANAPANDATYQAAAASVVRDAVPYAHNAFKIELAQRAVVRALRDAANLPAAPINANPTLPTSTLPGGTP